MDPDEGNKQHAALFMPMNVLVLHINYVLAYEKRLTSTIDSENYQPFKSNVVAMASIIAHSPWPMVKHYLDGSISCIIHM